MNAKKEIRAERWFQVRMSLAIVVIGAVLGFGASQWLELRKESSRKRALVRLICASIKNDLGYTVGTTVGLRNNMLKKRFGNDPTLFRLLYHPSVALPESTDTGLLNSQVIRAFDEYRRRLSECETRRQEYIRALEDPDHKDLEVTLFTYVIGLDSVIVTGANLLRAIESDYPGISGGNSEIATYAPLQGFEGDLQKVILEATAERWKNKKPNQASEATSGSVPRAASSAPQGSR